MVLKPNLQRGVQDHSHTC